MALTPEHLPEEVLAEFTSFVIREDAAPEIASLLQAEYAEGREPTERPDPRELGE